MFSLLCVMFCITLLTAVVGILVYKVALLSQRFQYQERQSTDLNEAFEYAMYLVGYTIGRSPKPTHPKVRFKEMQFLGGKVVNNVFYVSEEYRYNPEAVVQILCKLISRMLVKKLQTKEGQPVKEVKNPAAWLKNYFKNNK